jgi:hypothetical protein
LLGIGVLVMTLYFAVPVEADPKGGPLLRGILSVLVFAGLAVAVLTQVRLSMADESRRLDGLVVGILAVWVVFSFTFYALAMHQDDQVAGLHTRVDSLYFTASTMLTVGYGDVHATGQLARVLVLLQLLFDVVFVAAAASTLNSHLRRRAQERSTQRNPR